MTGRAEGDPGAEVRSLAAVIFRRCREDGLTVEEAMERTLAVATLPRRDRALLSNILLTSYRHLGEIGAILEQFLDRPLPRKSGGAWDILVLGVAQLLFLRMPAHAVIDQSVRTAKADRYAMHFSGLVNAVLRRVSSGGPGLLDGLDAARLNTPDWLWKRWSVTYGDEAASLIGRAHTHKPALDISLKPDAEHWVVALGGTRLPNGQLRLPADHVPVPELPGYGDGGWWIQDAAATIPVGLLGPVGGLEVLDLCAAPGGKTMQLAAGGARVTSVDISESRLARLRANLARTGLAAEVRCCDVLSQSLTGMWDAVVLDAPCSATGTIRRHPELPYLRKEQQLRELVALQRRMLRKAASMVKPGGILVYCTCSLEPEEGEAQIDWLLGWNSEFEPAGASLPWLPAEAVTGQGWMRTLPFMQFGNAYGLDGFFVAALRRRRG